MTSLFYIMKYLLIFTISLLLFSCKKESNNQVQVSWAGLNFPKHFPPPVYDMKDNPVTKAGFELGRKLFYDPILSRDNTISCASCHNQGSAFTHHGHDISHGIEDKIGRRNSLPIQNLLWQKSFFWDGGVHNIDLIPVNAITNPVEMDESLQNVISKLKNDAKYRGLFKNAFGSEEINSTRFLQSLSQFMSMLISNQSKYDKYLIGEEILTTQEMEGKKVFTSKCGNCHSGVLLTDESFRNNGVSNDFTYDKGRYEISLFPEDIGKFKVPSLRNVTITGPYMHNGIYETLEQVLNHYTSNIKDSPTLDPILKNNGKNKIEISDSEKESIIIFLKTLEDRTFVRDERFSDPN
jgi:cytochrome c peroxidase